MASRPISFAVEESDLELLEKLAEAFGAGNRSEFLRVAMKDYQKKLRFREMEQLSVQATAERGGKVFSTEETLNLINDLRTP